MQNYNVLLSKNLDSLENLPSSTLYRWLSGVHKDQYYENDRIVLYTSTTKFLDHLNFLLDYIDIGKYFVHICTNNHSTQKEFNDNEFATEIVDQLPIEETQNIIPIFDDGSMCAHPWAGFHVFPTGNCQVCCDADDILLKDDGTPCNIKTDSFEEILQSKSMRELRSAFRKGEKPSACNKCWERESRGEDSRRTLSKYKLKNIYGLVDWESEGSMRYFGGHLGNACNLSCRICSPTFSSVIATELNDTETNQKTRWVKNNSFWDQLPGNIKNIEILGGEPFYLKKNVDLLENIVRRDDSKDFMMAFTTNGTIYPSFLDHCERLGNLDLTVSIDNIGKRFELERNGASWQEVDNNVDKLVKKKQETDNISIFVCITVNIQNIYYLPEVLDWVKSKNLQYYFNYVYHPTWLNIRNLTTSARDLVINRLKSSEFDSIKSIIQHADGTGKEFVEQMKIVDQRRNQDFRLTHPEIAKTMGYV